MKPTFVIIISVCYVAAVRVPPTWTNNRQPSGTQQQQLQQKLGGFKQHHYDDDPKRHRYFQPVTDGMVLEESGKFQRGQRYRKPIKKMQMVKRPKIQYVPTKMHFVDTTMQAAATKLHEGAKMQFESTKLQREPTRSTKILFEPTKMHKGPSKIQFEPAKPKKLQYSASNIHFAPAKYLNHQVAPNFQQIAPSLHQDSNNLHQNAPSLHQSSKSSHQASTNLHQNAPSLHQSLKSSHKASPNLQQVPPSVHQDQIVKSTAVRSKNPPITYKRQRKPVDHPNIVHQKQFRPSVQLDETPSWNTWNENSNEWVPKMAPVSQPIQQFHESSTKRQYHEPTIDFDKSSELDIPTRPIYPGEGVWAVPGTKHQPYLKQEPLRDEVPQEDEVPKEGAHLFEAASADFENKSQKFKIRGFPKEVTTPEPEEEADDDFIPTRLYSQVRKYENEEHLPASILEPRLRKTIKDSKIHTVYTEEGYEDAAYDHAGHEKNAEENEGYEEHDGNDTEGAGSYIQPETSNFEETSLTKTTAMKENNSGNRQYEISSKMKIKVGPKNRPDIRYMKKLTRTNEPTVQMVEHKPEIDQDTARLIMRDISQHFINKNLARKKRFANDFLKIDVGKEFDIQLKDDLVVVTTEKYPYYKDKGINKMSALRFAEDMKHIPVKTGGKMAFYEQANQMECKEVQSDVNPVPKRIGEQENDDEEEEEDDGDDEDDVGDEEEVLADKKKVLNDDEEVNYGSEKIGAIQNDPVEDVRSKSPRSKRNGKVLQVGKMIQDDVTPKSSRLRRHRKIDKTPKSSRSKRDAKIDAAEDVDEEETPKSPRLEKLGDKIDCFKMKYFGENPLDSPFFDEKTVEAPEPIFQELRKAVSHQNGFKPVPVESASSESVQNLMKLLNADAKNVAHEKLHQKPKKALQNENEAYKEVSKEASNGNEDFYFRNVDNHKADQTLEYENLKKVNNPTYFQKSDTKKASTPLNLVKSYEAKIDEVSNGNKDSTKDFDTQNVDTNKSTRPQNSVHYEKAGTPQNINRNNVHDVGLYLQQSTEVPVHELVTITTNKPVEDYYEEYYDELSDDSDSKLEETVAKPTSSRQAKTSDLIFELQTVNQTAPSTYQTTSSASIPQIDHFEPMIQVGNQSISVNTTYEELEDDNQPQSLPLYLRRVRKRHPQPQNKFMYPIYRTTSTVRPKYNTISEVYYKDDIKPNEQLNVFADIINNIKNSTLYSQTDQTVDQKGPQMFQNHPPPKYPKANTRRTKIPIEKTKMMRGAINYLQTSTPQSIPIPIRKKYPVQQKNQAYENYMTNFKKQHPPITAQHDPTTTTTQKPKYKTKPKREPDPSNTKIVPDYPEPDYTDEGTVISGNTKQRYKNQKQPPSKYTTIDIPMNKYLVPGMKPPLSYEKPYIYSDFQLLSTNLLQRRNYHTNHRMRRSASNERDVDGRRKGFNQVSIPRTISPLEVAPHLKINHRKIRSASRFNYASIRRPTSRTPDEEEPEQVEEEDDYIPHRPTNYHYDPESEKIVYNHKKTTTTEVPEYIEAEYEEVEEEKPVVTTTHRTVYHKDVLNKENGPTLVDFINQLRSNPAYVVIKDPEPIEKNATTTTTTTPSPLKTTPPAFLSFLDKLHKSEGYIKIEDEDEKKPKKTTTTTTTTTEEPVVAEALTNVQNSPGGQFNAGGGFQLFDITEYIPKIKNYNPKTSIDYSKYKTIERTTSRHNLSSRYNEDEDELPLDKNSTSQKPIFINEEESNYQQEEDVITTTTTTTQSPTITTRKRRGRPTTRATTKSPTREETNRRTNVEEPYPQTNRRFTTTTEETLYTPATHRPPVRVYQRKPRPKIRLRTTTPALEESEEDVTHKSRRTQRKLDALPSNHKAFYSPIVVEDRIDITNPVYVENNKRARLVTPDIINQTNTRINPDNHINPRKLDIEVFKDFDEMKKHGGNYLRDTTTTAVDEKMKDGDVVGDKLAVKMNKVKEAGEGKDYDYNDEVMILFQKGEKKKTAFIKDPSRRLYYYAPVN